MIEFPADSVLPKRARRVVLAMGLVLCAGAAFADTPLAAPGECAQPREPLVTQPVQPMPAAVAGRATDAFAPTEPPSEERPRTLTDLLGLTSTSTTSTNSVGVNLDTSETAIRVDMPVLEVSLEPDVKSPFDTKVHIDTGPLPLDVPSTVEKVNDLLGGAL